MFSLRAIRHSGRSYSTIILILTTIFSTLLMVYLYRKDKQRRATIEQIPLSGIKQSEIASSSITKAIRKTFRTGI